MRSRSPVTSSRRVSQAERAGAPVLPGGEVNSAADARALGERIGYPVLVKAAGGGGGRGIRHARDGDELEAIIGLARTEAAAAFADDRLYVEKLVPRARHVEVQIAADEHGAVVHLGERDCSVQRRFQKLIEEAPAPALPSGARGRLLDAAVAVARAIGYANLGTVEFVLDADTDDFFFLEVNCRIQVEHPVTEAITGRDLVALQLRIADGEPLGFTQEDVTAGRTRRRVPAQRRGRHEGLSCRAPARLSIFAVPELPGLRVDTHCYPGAVVPPYYDSLLAKLIGHGDDREQALDCCSTGGRGARHRGRRDQPNAVGSRARPPRVPGRPGDDRVAAEGDPMIEFVDTTTRDGNQSLWSATGLTTPDVLSIAPTLDQVGYHALDFTSSTHMAVSVRFHREDPWERIRLVSEAMPNTPLGMITTGMRFISWVPADEEVMRLSFRLVARNGIRRFQIADPSNDPARLRHLAAIARAEGIDEVVIGLTYSISEVHTHEYYAQRAAALAGCVEMDRLYLKDPGGLLTPDAVRELAPHFLAASGPGKAELHSHCTIGLAPLVYMEGVHAGFEVLHTASGALSRGTSQPDVLATVRNLEALGYRHGLDLERQARVSAHFDALGAAKGLPSGAPREFDAAYYRHQLPGGMVTTTRRMLEELRRPELFDAVLEEVGRVRAEMGYPIIVTPVSQFIASQAARNVIDGERWANVSDETVRFFLGHYGDPPAPVDPQVADRVLSRPQARALAGLEPLSLDGARERFGTRISDEELLLRLTMPAEQVDAMVAARGRDAARPQTAGSDRSPLVTLLSELERRPDLAHVSIVAGADRVVWRRA